MWQGVTKGARQCSLCTLSQNPPASALYLVGRDKARARNSDQTPCPREAWCLLWFEKEKNMLSRLGMPYHLFLDIQASLSPSWLFHNYHLWKDLRCRKFFSTPTFPRGTWISYIYIGSLIWQLSHPHHTPESRIAKEDTGCTLKEWRRF